MYPTQNINKILDFLYKLSTNLLDYQEIYFPFTLLRSSKYSYLDSSKKKKMN